MKERSTKVYRNHTLEKARLKAAGRKYSGRSIYEHVVFITVITLICCAVDFYTIKSEWTVLRADDIFFIYGKSLVNAFGLDVSLSILAVAQRRKECKMLGSINFRLILVLSLTVFGLALFFELYLAYLTGKYTFDVNSGSSMIVVDGQTISAGGSVKLSGSEVVTISLINGLTPLLTSIVVYITSYFSTNPIRDELCRIHKEMIRSEHAQLDHKVVLAELANLNKHFELLSSYENACYEAHRQELECLEILRNQITYLTAMKMLGNESIAALKEEANKMNEELKSSDSDLKQAAEGLTDALREASRSLSLETEDSANVVEKSEPVLVVEDNANAA